MPKKINMKKGTAVILVVILMMALLVLGAAAAYQFGVVGKQKSEASQSVAPVQQTELDVQDRSEDISKVGAGDKISNIEEDLDKTDIDSIDKDVLGVKTETQGL